MVFNKKTKTYFYFYLRNPIRVIVKWKMCVRMGILKSRKIVSGNESVVGDFVDLDRECDITAEELRSSYLFKDSSEAEIAEVIETIKRFTVIMYELFRRRHDDTNT